MPLHFFGIVLGPAVVAVALHVARTANTATQTVKAPMMTVVNLQEVT
jgi:hypothetical protein